MLNGVPGTALLHCQGLWQGGPHVRLLSILLIDPLHYLLQLATDSGMIQPLSGQELKLHVSLYADDAVLFANLVQEEIDNLMIIIQDFGEQWV